jgi:hypothetical protein
MRATTRLPLAGAALVLLASLLAGPAAASELVGRNAHHVRLTVSRSGRVALLTWREDGHAKQVRAWGAINARAPSESVPQVQMALNYAGGLTLRGGCRPYTGPKLGWVVQACDGRDGSYWAVQNWARLVKPGQSPADATWELRLSHWSGPIAQISVKTDWALRQYDDVYGQYTYRGQPIHGFHSTHGGAPLDSYGRNLYLDTLNSSYGSGWRRENGFLARKPNGGFCYAMYHGKGQAYRLSSVGPGVTPDVFVEVAAPGAYDRARDLEAAAEQRALLGKVCY